ncbi:MAG: metallophosphoesterase [Rhodomicrobium sp.]|jgi:predicted MPP superfamily phosphohydrolase
MLSAADAFAVEPRFGLIVKRWDVVHPAWPAGAPPLRIGVLTDIHAVKPWMDARRIGGIVERLNAERPDVIVLLGDYVNALRRGYYSSLVPVAEWSAALHDLRAPLGVYAVLGNHDWLSGEAPAIRSAFHRAGIGLLEGSAIKVERGRFSFWIVGLDDLFAADTRGYGNVQVGLAHVTDGAPIVLLAHEPDIFSVVPEKVALTLAGHTHGGQVYIPFVGRPSLAPGMARYAKYAYGHIEERGRHLVVSSGLGLSAYPVRFLVPPEIAVVTLGAPAIRERSQSSFNA